MKRSQKCLKMSKEVEKNPTISRSLQKNLKALLRGGDSLKFQYSKEVIFRKTFRVCLLRVFRRTYRNKSL